MRDKELVKEELLRVCKEYDFNEVYVNFDNPFGEVHNEEHKRIYVVLRSKYNSAGKFQLKAVFDPSYKDKNPRDYEHTNVGVTVINGTYEEKEEATWKLVQKGYRLLYYKGAGICFE